MLKPFFCFWLILSISGSVYGQKIFVAVAANMQLPCEEIEAAFEAESNISVELIIGASGKLTAQIKNGAPYHLFLSADMKYPAILYESGYTRHSPQIYAYGVPVLWLKTAVVDSGLLASNKLEEHGPHPLNPPALEGEGDLTLPSPSRAGGEVRQPLKTAPSKFLTNILESTKIKKIAIADPRLAPYGIAAMQILKHFMVEETAKNKLVFGNSIAGVNQYIAAGVVEVAITAVSARQIKRLKDRGIWLKLPDESYSTISQGIILLKHSQKNLLEASQRFYHFLFSETARSILQKHGYRLP